MEIAENVIASDLVNHSALHFVGIAFIALFLFILLFFVKSRINSKIFWIIQSFLLFFFLFYVVGANSGAESELYHFRWFPARWDNVLIWVMVILH